MSLLESYQIHRYKNGHQRVHSTIELDRIDQDLVDRLSDISGQVRPNEIFAPYFTCYPLPSQKYFIVARTWQDFVAPRAGCVVTKSIAVPMKLWEVENNIGEIFINLIDFSEKVERSNENIDSKKFLLEPIKKDSVEEVVEALFLEQRKPIVVFNCEEADKILFRIYSVLWRGIRQGFSSCSFALAPRTINGRSFDLLFTLDNLRARFVDWKGRRIEGNTLTKYLPRHRWTQELAYNIFLTRIPSLLSDKNLKPVFILDEFSDGSGLRLILMWNELYSKVETESSPFAILGLLDIINSQPIFAEDLYAKLQPYIDNAVSFALSELAVPEAWKFYSSLLVKHQKKLMTRKLLASVRDSVNQLTRIDPVAAISFISNFQPIDNKIPSVLYAGIGDGLSKSIITLPSLLSELQNNITLLVIAASDKFAKSLMELTKNDIQWNDYIISALDSPDEKIVKRATEKISENITIPPQEKIVNYLLERSDEKEFKRITSSIAKNTEFSVEAFFRSIVSSSIRLSQNEFILDLILAFDTKGNSDKLLVKLVVSQPSMLKLILANASIDFERKSEILDASLKDLPISTLLELMKDKNLVSNVLDYLLKAELPNYDLICNVVMVSGIPVSEALGELNKLPNDVLEGINSEGVRIFLEKAFRGETENYFDELKLFVSKLHNVSSDDIIKYAFINLKDDIQILQNFYILTQSGDRIVKELSKKAIYVSELIASSAGDKISLEVSQSWIQLLISVPIKEDQMKVASIMLDFSYKCKDYDPTLLLLACFPIIYKTFLRGQSIPSFISVLFFPDWDKCKTLRYVLVDKYMDSKWSPFGLFRIANAANILEDIIDIVLSRKGGKRYIRSGIAEAKKNSDPKKKIVLEQLEEILKD